MNKIALFFFVFITFKKLLSSILIIAFVIKDSYNIKNKIWLDWKYCYTNNIIYTPGCYLYETKDKNLCLRDFILFAAILCIIKIIIKIQIIFTFFIIILKKLNFNIERTHTRNLYYNMFINIPIYTAERITKKKINKENIFNILLNLAMSYLFFFGRLNIQKSIEFFKIYNVMEKNTHGSKKKKILLYKTLKIIINNWKFPI